MQRLRRTLPFDFSDHHCLQLTCADGSTWVDQLSGVPDPERSWNATAGPCLVGLRREREYFLSVGKQAERQQDLLFQMAIEKKLELGLLFSISLWISNENIFP